MEQKPTLTITYCRVCHFMPRAAWVAQELLHTFEEYLGGVTLVPGGRGQFDIALDGDVIFSNKAAGRFPEMRELREAIAERIEGAPKPRHSSVSTAG